ncbi:PREDICTED: cadherin-13-like, partial [Acanthisitta chloris]|uniref:cadherin-13-like n=1 Tax=Acanthisitta chloris TaxID=57068 RepID=UPI0004F0E1BD
MDITGVPGDWAQGADVTGRRAEKVIGFPAGQCLAEGNPPNSGFKQECCQSAPVLLLACAEDLECVPGFQQKVFYIEKPFQFTEDKLVLNLEFDDCKGNNKLNFEVSNPDFTVEQDGSLVALKNLSEVGTALFVHARSEHAEDTAKIFIVKANEKHGALKEIFKPEGNFGIPRQKRAILATPILIPENQRPPFPRAVGRVIRSEGTEGAKFHLSGRGVDQDPKGIFRINEVTGDVSVTRALDREAIANYE